MIQSQDKYGDYSSIFICGMLVFFTVFVKGIPLVTVINEDIGGDKYEPSSKAIVLQGTLFVIRSIVKFLTMNYGCALSDFVGRKPIVVLFLIPNLILDCLLLFGDMSSGLIYAVGGLWGFAAITIPCLRAWLCDQMDNPVDTIAAQGAFRGFAIGVATIFGIPLGTILVLVNAPRYAFGVSLAANILAVVITYRSHVPDITSIHHRKEKRESARILQLVDVDVSDSFHRDEENHSYEESLSSASSSFDIVRFLKEHSPLAGFQVITERTRGITWLWISLFLSFCANETFIHTLFNYLLVGGGFSPLQASMGFMLAGISYFVVVENMLLYVGGVKANLVGLLVTVCISILVSATSLYGPLATAGAWVFMLLLPFDPSHAGINGMLSQLYDESRHGEVQGVIEQLSTLGVVGGYPGTLMFGYFISSSAPFYWPGAPYFCAAVYASIAAWIFHTYIYKESDGKHLYPKPDNCSNKPRLSSTDSLEANDNTVE